MKSSQRSRGEVVALAQSTHRTWQRWSMNWQEGRGGIGPGLGVPRALLNPQPFSSPTSLSHRDYQESEDKLQRERWVETAAWSQTPVITFWAGIKRIFTTEEVNNHMGENDAMKGCCRLSIRVPLCSQFSTTPQTPFKAALPAPPPVFLPDCRCTSACFWQQSTSPVQCLWSCQGRIMDQITFLGINTTQCWEKGHHWSASSNPEPRTEQGMDLKREDGKTPANTTRHWESLARAPQ